MSLALDKLGCFYMFSLEYISAYFFPRPYILFSATANTDLHA